MKKLLTKRKQKWVSSRRPDVVQGNPLNSNAAVEMRYQKKLDRLIAQMTEETEKSLRKLFEGRAADKYFAEDASIASQAKALTDALIRKFDQLFASAAEPMAETFAASADAASATAVHSSLQQLSGGLSLPTSAITAPMKEILKATITENVGLIKSIPSQYLTGVQGAVMRSITTGNGMQDLVPYLKKHKDITQRRARMIAKNETSKAFSGLNRERMKRLGVKKYRWLHTAGSNEPRKLHIHMSGEIYSWDDPPIIDEKTGERGHPGQAINCRCKAVPVLEFDDGEE